MKTDRFSAKAQGNSMYPLLQHNDIVEYVHMPFGKIRLNDIVLLYVGDILITHRVIYKTKHTCITRGDNNSAADPLIRKGRVLAKVVRFRRRGVWHDIQEVYLTQSALYLHEIQKLETLLQIKKLPHVFLKGVLVSLRYEGSIPRRIYADCDILVPKNWYAKMEKLFLLLGYKSIALSETDSVPYFKKIDQQPEVNFTKIVQGIPVVFDVHFEPVFLMSRLAALSLLYPNNLLQSLGNLILSRSVIKNVKGFHYSLCSIPDQILYLALHIFHHNFTDSVRYQLLDAVIRKSANKKDWNEVQNTIKEYRLEGYLYLVFIILRKYFKTPIPQSFISAIKPSYFKRKASAYFLRRIDIFSQDSRVKAGIERFILIFLLSPNPFWKKLLLFVHPEVLYSATRLVLSFVASRISQASRRFVRG